jgi:ADP-ribose pyrophosphatase YjhB (NUDIX family)
VQVDVTGAGSRWIPEEEYVRIVRRVPIPCVDLLPLSQDRSARVGLILRETVGGGRGWCLVGGAVLLNEPLVSAIRRHLCVTLGDAVEFDAETLRLSTVIEYFSRRDVGEFHDPRKHAIALTYTAVCTGTPEPAGEALDFRWFAPSQLPADDEFGFGQDRVVRRLVHQLDLHDANPPAP